MNTYLQNATQGVCLLLMAQSDFDLEAEKLLPLDIARGIEQIEKSVRQSIRSRKHLIDLLYDVLDKFQVYRASVIPERPLDPCGEVDANILTIEDSLRSDIAFWDAKHSELKNGPYFYTLKELSDQVRSLAKTTIDLTQKLRWEISEHDADLETALPEKFESVEELLAALKA